MSNAQNLIEEVRSLEAQYIAGALSVIEYKELLEDIKHTKIIQVAADDLALKTQLNEIIEDLITVATAI